MNILKMQNINKSFGDNHVLKDVSISVEKGDVLSIIGPSGSGKSTLLRIATLLETLDSGECKYFGEDVCTVHDGKPVYKKDLKKFIRYFGLVFQSFNLFPHYTVLKNICEGPITIQKRDPDEVKEEALGLLKKMDLEGKADAYPCQLSGGQQQRVSIVRALAMKPEILFFDEPTSALDPELTREVLRVIRQLAEEKMTMVIVTHEMAFARAVSDRVVFIDHGTVIEEGRPEELFDNPSNERTRRFLSQLSD